MSRNLRATVERWRPRLPWLIAGVAGLTSLGLAIALLAIGDPKDDRPRASVGEQIKAPVDELPHRAEVTLPWNNYKVAIGGADPELPDLASEPSNLQAPEGGSFVPIMVEPQYRSTMTGSDFADPETEVVIRADGRDYELSDDLGLDFQSTSANRATWLAVSGRPQQVTLRITVDGETQEVSAEDGSVDPGRAAELDGLPSPSAARKDKPVRCGPATRLDDSELKARLYARDSCALNPLVRTPYVPTLGWAPEGREYAVLSMSAPSEDFLSIRDPGPPADAEYWRATMRLSLRLGTVKPVTEPTASSFFGGAGIYNAQQWVFEIATDQELGDLSMTGEIRANRGAPFVTDRERLRVSWTIAGEKLA